MILWTGKSKFNGKNIGLIMTGLSRKSKNPKTGEVVQGWIIPKENPVKQLNNRKNHPVCNNCPLIKRGCYVNISWAVMAVWQAWRKNKYPVGNVNNLKGKIVRLGAYGEPSALPATLINKITKVSKGVLAYTHQWMQPWAYPYKRYCMASVETKELKDRANSKGWKTFRIGKSLEDKLPDEILCPASKEYKEKTNKSINCSQCMLCQGNNSRTPKNIFIVAHGGKAKLPSILKYLDEVNNDI